MCFRPSNTESKSMTTCPSCGKSNDPDATACRSCGASLNGASEGLPPIAPPQAPAVASTVVPGLHNLPHLAVDYPELPGAAAIRTNLIGSSINDGAFWRFLKKGVAARKDRIDCWYASPVTALIQDPVTKAVVGVEIERDGKKLNIAARKGVIMALGGYENSASCTQQYLDAPKVLPAGTLYNEGDGMRMAQSAGARMWHLNAWKGGGVGLVPEQDRMRGLGDIAFFKTGSVMLVGGDARRYLAEDLEQRNGRVPVGGSWVLPARPDVNCFIFDEAQRRALEDGTLPRPFPNWSLDLESEVAAGKVVRSDTVWGLAEGLSLDAATLQATIDAFNEAAASGRDAFGRKPESMRAFGMGPYYGVSVFPAVLATYGGPERTAKAEILGADGSPIPHLYAAGEFGSIVARHEQGGGSLSECVVFGGIAGREAAAEKDDSFEPSIPEGALGPGSGDVSVYDLAPDESGLSANEAIGVGKGLGGPLWVKVTSERGAVKGVEVLRHSEHADVGAAALDVLAACMAEAGSADVDAVSGATVTSLGMAQAVRDALGKAK